MDNAKPAKSIGELIDELYIARAERIKLEAEVNAQKAVEKQTRELIIEQLTTAGLKGGKGSIATAAITKKIKPLLVAWNKVYSFIIANESFELLHQRITSTYWQALLDDGIEVPGIVEEEVIDLSLVKGSK
mgnify:FL=1